ncbi:MAG: cytochrome b/b6 domain-containing protein [Rhodoferax sp.]|nr:cytochrome b/b6 domain-containing protein [Rhodoferax sp.]
MQRILIWDIPTRLFHWTLAVSFAVAWLTSESDEWLGVHVFFGYLMLGMVAFRVLWGLVGTHYARFSSFWFGPNDALTYLRQVMKGHAARHIGHNPTGSAAIYLLLLLTVAVGLTGFFTLGTEEQQGAAAGWLSIAQGRTFKKLHEAFAIGMLLLVIGHIAGVVIESVLHKENLARSMVTGTKLAPNGAVSVKPRTLIAVLMLILVGSFGVWWFSYALHAPIEKQFGRPSGSISRASVPFVGTKLPDNAQWREECGSCHIPFYPALLPVRSWARTLAEQDKHFGTDLGLDAGTSVAILAFLTANAAERHLTEAGLKIDRSLAPNAAPLRITETPYWIKKHREIPNATWLAPKVKSKTNCDACHLDAMQGTYEDAAMRLPKP